MTGGFTVNAAALAQAGREITGYADQAHALGGQLDKAQVPMQSWGLLGNELGLYDQYIDMLTDLRDGLHQMGVSLDTAGGRFATMQQEYENRDKEIARVLNGIGGDAAAGAGIGWNIAGATVGGTIGGAVGAAVKMPKDTDNAFQVTNTLAKDLSTEINNSTSGNKAQDYIDNPDGNSSNKKDGSEGR